MFVVLHVILQPNKLTSFEGKKDLIMREGDEGVERGIRGGRGER